MELLISIMALAATAAVGFVGGMLFTKRDNPTDLEDSALQQPVGNFQKVAYMVADENIPDAFNSPVTSQYKVLANNPAINSQFSEGADYAVDFTPWPAD